MKAFCSWSGGKDSAMALYKAKSRSIEFGYLLNMATENGMHSRTHGLASDLLFSQAEALKTPLIQQKVSWDNYEQEFRKALEIFKTKGLENGVFGDIDLIEHRQWVESICKSSRISPVFPLWQKQRENILTDFIDAGFRAVVVATDTQYLGEEWLGREIDRSFVNDLKSFSRVDLCGEKGEYHTFVYDGPIFEKPVEFCFTGKAVIDSYRFLELSPGNKNTSGKD